MRDIDVVPAPSHMNETIPAPSAWRLENARWTFLVRNAPSSAPAGVSWHWRAIAANGVRWEGEDAFGTRPLCEADAATHGYLPRPERMKEAR